jgi:hypothetical protein
MVHHFLEKPELSYLVGFLQSDGHHQANTRNRGKITVELQVGDRPLLEAFQRLISVYTSLTERTRDTNYKQNYTSCTLSVYDWEIRQELERLGVIVGRKSESVQLPNFDYSPSDYFRGLVDGDGSLGMTEECLPFLSLTTASDAIAFGFVEYVKSVTGRMKKANRNRRDAIYNLMVSKEGAQAVAHSLYSGSTLRLERKFAAYEELMKWVRPVGMAKREPGQWWTTDQDEYLRNHSLEESMAYLGRSLASVQMRRYRLEGRYQRKCIAVCDNGDAVGLNSSRAGAYAKRGRAA